MEQYGYILDTSRLEFEGDFDEQVNDIMQYIRLTKQEVQNLQILLDDLQQAFSEVWQGCEVKGFGSIVTGLGIKTSDIDCFVQLPSWLCPPEQAFVMRARNFLKQHYRVFQQVFAISTAKVPIVKFYHVPTRRCCDVNFSSPNGIQNSQLISYFLGLDQRALNLAILVKYWSKVHNLSGVNLMPNYCLTMLVIFYLQQQKILPPVTKLQENIEEYYVNNWNTALNYLQYNNQNSSTLYQLLGGFFKYYYTFKYADFIISPFIGRPVERKLFCEAETVPSEFYQYKHYMQDENFILLRLDTFMCVQDPYEHNKNSAVAVHPKLAQTVLTHFRMGADFFDTCQEKNYLKKLLEKVLGPIKAKKKRKNNKGVNKLQKPQLTVQQIKQLKNVGSNMTKNVKDKK